MSKINVFLYLHTHWDREWYRTFEDFRVRLLEVFENIYEDLKNDKIPSFYFDGQTVALQDFLEIYPEKIDEIKELIQNNRLFIGPWFALADEFLVSGEALARNLLKGILFSKKMGIKADFIGYLPDAFAHSGDMPLLFNHAGIDKAIVWRGASDNKTDFIWKSKDDSAVRAYYLTEGYFMDIFSANVSLEKKAEMLKTLLDKISKFKVDNNILLPVGADHLGVMRDIKSQVEEMNSLLSDYELKLASIDDYFKHSKIFDLNVVDEELRNPLRNFILPSCASSRVYLKQQNADVTWGLTKVTEPFMALLSENKFINSRKNLVDYGYELLFKNHAHDGICGCSIDEVHREIETRNAKISQLSSSLNESGMFKLGCNLKKGNLYAFNSSVYNFSGVFEFSTDKKLPSDLIYQEIGSFKAFPKEIIADVNRIPVQEDYAEFKKYLVYASSINPLTVSAVESKNFVSDLISDENLIENSYFNFKINRDATVQLIDKNSGRVLKDFLNFEDVNDEGDTYNFSPDIEERTVKRTSILRDFVFLENGDLRKTLRLFYEIDMGGGVPHNFLLDVSLKAHSKLIEFKVLFDNEFENHLFRAKFSLEKPVSNTVSESAFGTVERTFDPDYSIYDNLPAPVGKELVYNTAPMKRFVSAQGVTIFTKGISEYEVYKNSLSLNLLRAVGKLSGGKIPTRGTPAGPPLPTPEAQCLRSFEFEFAVSFEEQISEKFKLADFYYNPILAFMGLSETDSLEFKNVLFGNENIYLCALKESENNDNKLVLRLFNISSEQQVLEITGVKSIFEADLLENIISDKLNVVEFKPYQLKTLIVDI